ncbi:MAG: 6-pyruvoyl tetrahydropterin reductase [Pseudomonadales bacterium]|nr:6-pyruvoyl tetrahydropterin reductase [Pseudomonadales bacterium]
MSALFVNHLTVLDFSYADARRGILGESWIVDIELYGELDHQGMVFDFGAVKKQVRDAVESLFDHQLVVPSALPALQARELGQSLALSWQDQDGRDYRHLSPPSAVLQVTATEITPATMIPLLEETAMAAVPDNVSRVAITLREEEISGACYQYSHGLKKHQGNCQRIAHGHRSRLKIYRNGKRDPLLEQAWALKWRDIYIGTRADLAGQPSREGVEYCQFAYDAPQGRFELELPAAQVYLIDTDSTVEYLAEHIAETLHREDPEHQFQVLAYEGVMKGAIAFK